MSNVRAKVRVESLTRNMWGGASVRLSCQYDDSIPEDQRFAKATPSGHVELVIDNPEALAVFDLGKTFYLDFTVAS